MSRKKPHELAHNEWYDGAGDLQTEKWYLVLLDTNEEKQDLGSYSGPMGTREQAEALLLEVAQGWGRNKRLAVVQVFEPEIVEYKATVSWPDKEDPPFPGAKFPDGPCPRCGPGFDPMCGIPPQGPPGCRCQDEGNDEGCEHCR